MPPTGFSRHLLTISVARIEDGLEYLLDREPFRFVNRGDNKRVIAAGTDTWHSLAFQHLAPIANAADLWWLIADFQPEPVVDPTILPVPGSTVYIPSTEFVLSTIFSENNADLLLI